MNGGVELREKEEERVRSRGGWGAAILKMQQWGAGRGFTVIR